jgi:hypothetical protein
MKETGRHFRLKSRWVAFVLACCFMLQAGNIIDAYTQGCYTSVSAKKEKIPVKLPSGIPFEEKEKESENKSEKKSGEESFLSLLNDDAGHFRFSVSIGYRSCIAEQFNSAHGRIPLYLAKRCLLL